MRPRAVLLCILLPGMTGCYTYADTGLDAVDVGTRVRAHVRPLESERLESLIGFDSRVVAGRVMDLRQDSLWLAVRVPLTPGRADSRHLAQILAIPRTGLSGIETRQIHRGRTIGLVAGTAALLGFIVYQAFVRSDPPGTPGENPPPVNQSLRPRLHSIPPGPW